jgi:hypothetical protein
MSLVLVRCKAGDNLHEVVCELVVGVDGCCMKHLKLRPEALEEPLEEVEADAAPAVLIGNHN